MIIFFDIETILDESQSRKALSVHKEDMESSGKEGFDFMPEYHQILTITTGANINGEYIIKNLEGDEYEQIKKFFEIASTYTLCGFNIKAFDIPFIIKRALKLGIAIPNKLKLFGKKPWDMDNMIDLYEVYKHTGYKSGSLDLVCTHIGIPTPKRYPDGETGEHAMTGENVQEYHDNGRDDEIREYCKRDVLATMQVYDYFVKCNLI